MTDERVKEIALAMLRARIAEDRSSNGWDNPLSRSTTILSIAGDTCVPGIPIEEFVVCLGCLYDSADRKHMISEDEKPEA